MNIPFLILLCFILAFSSCQKSSPPAGNSARISIQSEPPTLDWNLATDNVSLQILNQLMEGLTQYDDDLQAVPAIAQSWEVLDNGKTYIFHLNPAIRWSDGKPVTARDFKYSWLRLLRPETGAQYAYFLYDIEGAQEFNSGKLKDEKLVGIEAVDDLTFKVRLKNPVVYFPSITTFMVTFPVREDIVEHFGSRWTEPQNIKTCGPYRLLNWQHEYKVELEENPYYGGTPHPQVKKLTFFAVPDPSTALSLYEIGELDIVNIPPIALPSHQKHPERVTMTKLRGYYYGFNILESPFNNPLVRKAFALSLDKTVIPAILKGNEKTTDSWIPPGMFGHEPSLGLHFDTEKARDLLQKAGYGDTRPFPPVTLAFNNDAVNRKLAEWAQGQWKKNIGIDVRLDSQEWKSYLSLLDHDPPGLFRMGWGADFPDPDNFMGLFTSYSGNNYTNWKSPAFDRLIREGAMEKSLEKRKEIYDQAQRMLLEEDTVIIPLHVITQNLLVKKKFHPYPESAMDFVYYKKLKVTP